MNSTITSGKFQTLSTYINTWLDRQVVQGESDGARSINEPTKTISVHDLLNLIEKPSETGVRLDEVKGDALLPQLDRETMLYVYSQLYDFDELPSRRPERTYSKLIYSERGVHETIETLKGTTYYGLDIIRVAQDGTFEVDETILRALLESVMKGQRLTDLENLILDVGLYVKNAPEFAQLAEKAGEVHVPSQSNEISMETYIENLNDQIVQLRVIGESMKGISELQPGARVPMSMKTEGTRYKKGDIIVFYRGEIQIVHQVEFVYESNDKTFYVTQGVNAKTNKYVDRNPVCEDDVIGKVDLSQEAYLALNKMMATRYIPTFKAHALTQSLQSFVDFINRKSYIINKAFYRVRNLANMKGLMLVSQYNHDVELGFKEYMQAVLDAYDSNKYPGDATLFWKHEDCETVFKNSYNNVRQNIGICPECDSPWKNQQKTHKILEALFGQKFEKEVHLTDIQEIINDILTNSIYEEYLEKMDVMRMRLDDYAELEIKDKNGNCIKLAIESQGPQHYENNKGFKAFLFFEGFDGEKGDLEWNRLYYEWIISLDRDELKQLVFENNRDKGYYLITVNNELSAEERVNHIIDTLSNLTKIDLGYLKNNNKIIELLNIIR